MVSWRYGAASDKALALLTLCVAADARSWRPADIASPDVAPCGQARRVCDPLGYLADGYEAIGSALNALEKDFAHPDCGSYEMGVAVVDHVRGGSENDVAEFAAGVMDAWGVGKSPCNNGIVLAVAVEDRKVFLATGKGAKEFVPDEELSIVVERMKPLLRDGNYAGAVTQSISDVARILSGESLNQTDWTIFAAFVGAVGALLGRQQLNMRKYNACRRKLTAIEEQRSRALASAYEQESCAICLETFKDTPKQETELLVCGHKFHASCISGWEDKRSTCPICRQPTAEPLAPAGQSSSAGSQFIVRRQQNVLTHYDDEYRFRLSRARHYYPQYVTDDMVCRWSRPDHNGQLVADTGFIRRSPNYVDPASSRSSGRNSSSSTYGGGCSFDGGGAGGSW